ncbi:MAG: DUF4139 domain-containing protein [Candidatus Solibacter sp.]
MKLRLPVSLFLSSALAFPADLPVKQVVLYKHGVGFFERSGRLAPGESARLDFHASEMNDVLKSLTLGGGGKVSGLRYDSQDPIGHKLEEFPFRIGEGGLPAMLDQLKGSRVELKLGTETVAGTIVGARTIPATDKQAQQDQLTLLLDTAEFRTVDLGAASGLRFPDAKLQQQFKDYLAALVASRSKEKRTVYIESSDSGQRDITASYLIPAPVWKSSYRLIFGAKEPTLEGWAIVDNTTGEDWTKVNLSLVSGRPISFVSQLYAPKYITRPSAELADDAAAQVVVHSGAFEERKAVADAAGVGGMLNRARASAAPAAPPAMFLQAMAESVEVAPSRLESTATGRELGDLFEYRIAQPVTIRQNESAMLPFLQQTVAGRKLLIYSNHGSQHPTNAAELTNSTSLTLDGGPITVYDAGAYAGEALMETLKAGDKRLISYAVDLGTRITENFGSKNAVVREIHASRGILTTRYAAEETRTYTIRNVDQKAKTLVLEHPIRQDYTLLNQKPSEKTANAYRFEVQLAAGQTQEFVVNEERVYSQSTQVTNMSPDILVNYLQNRSLTPAARQQLQRIADQQRLIADNNRAIQDADSQVNSLNADENRVRQNIQSLNNVAGQQQQVQTYARQLDTMEQQLAALRDRQAELQKKRGPLQTDLNKLVEALTF